VTSNQIYKSYWKKSWFLIDYDCLRRYTAGIYEILKQFEDNIVEDDRYVDLILLFVSELVQIFQWLANPLMTNYGLTKKWKRHKNLLITLIGNINNRSENDPIFGEYLEYIASFLVKKAYVLDALNLFTINY